MVQSRELRYPTLYLGRKLWGRAFNNTQCGGGLGCKVWGCSGYITPLEGGCGWAEEGHGMHDEDIVHVDEEGHALRLTHLTQIYLQQTRGSY